MNKQNRNILIDTENILMVGGWVKKVRRLRSTNWALAGVAQWVECWPGNQGSPVGFPVRTHAWVVGQVPSWGLSRGNDQRISRTSMLPSVPFTLPSPLSKNK